MLTALGWSLAGLVALIAGAEILVRAGAALAARLGVPPIVIGLTVVAVGTSTPELAVGIDAAVRGNGSLAVGNIAGTNTANILLILGIAALIKPIPLRLQTLRIDLPVMVATALLLWHMASDGVLSWTDGMVLLAGGVAYTSYVVHSARNESRAVRRSFAEAYAPERRARERRDAVRESALLLLGLVVIVAAADWFVDGTVALARLWGVSDAFIGLTVVAIGTSSPELVTAVLSSFRGQRDIAIGNLLGSSVYNIVFILGATCLFPADGVAVAAELVEVDIPVMAAVALLCAPVFLSGSVVSRREGGIFVIAYLAYLGYLLAMRT